MNVLWVLIKKNFKLLFLKKSSIIAFIIPVIFTLACIQVGNMYGSSLKMAVIDNDKTVSSGVLINSVKDMQGSKIAFVNIDNENAIKSKILQRDADLVINIPKDFEKNLKKGEAKDIEISAIKGSNVQNFTKSLVNFQVKNLNDIGKASLGDENKFKEMVNGYNAKDETVQLKSIKDVGKDYESTKMSIGILIFFLLVRALSTSSLVKKERDNNTYTRTFMAPVSSIQYLGANIIVNAFILVIQILIVQISMQYILKLETGVSFITMFALLFLISLVAVAIGTLCIALFKDEQSITLALNLIIMGTCMISGCFIPFELLPEKVQNISVLTPQRWVMDAVNKLQLGMEVKDVALNMLILVAFSIAFFMIAAYKVKVSEKEYN